MNDQEKIAALRCTLVGVHVAHMNKEIELPPALLSEIVNMLYATGPEEEVGESPSGEMRMLYVGDSKQSFHCTQCGANVFTKIGERRYRCNGCSDTYSGM